MYANTVAKIRHDILVSKHTYIHTIHTPTYILHVHNDLCIHNLLTIETLSSWAWASLCKWKPWSSPNPNNCDCDCDSVSTVAITMRMSREQWSSWWTPRDLLYVSTVIHTVHTYIHTFTVCPFVVQESYLRNTYILLLTRKITAT